MPHLPKLEILVFLNLFRQPLLRAAGVRGFKMLKKSKKTKKIFPFLKSCDRI
jgi:hypothetical protein